VPKTLTTDRIPRRPGKFGGKPSVVVDNTLDRQFEVEAPNNVWVTHITYIKTDEGFSYLAVVIDLFSRRVMGWSMQNWQPTDLGLSALLYIQPVALLPSSSIPAFAKSAQGLSDGYPFDINNSL
jgi:transposase InsO family protein